MELEEHHPNANATSSAPRDEERPLVRFDVRGDPPTPLQLQAEIDTLTIGMNYIHRHEVPAVRQEVMAVQRDLAAALGEIQSLRNDINSIHGCLREWVNDLEVFKTEVRDGLKGLAQKVTTVTTTTMTAVAEHHRQLMAVDARHTQEIQCVLQSLRNFEARHAQEIMAVMQRQQAAEAHHAQEIQGITQSLRNLEATFHHQVRTVNEHVSANTASVQKDLAALRLQLEQSTSSTEPEPLVLVGGKGLGRTG